MSDIHVKGTIDKHYQAQVEVDGFQYQMDHADLDGNRESTGTNPVGLLLSSLAGCQLMTAMNYFKRQNISYQELKVEIKGRFPRVKGRSRMEAEVLLQTDAKLDDEGLEKLKRYLTSYCTVGNVIEQSPNNQITTKIQLIS